MMKLAAISMVKTTYKDNVANNLELILFLDKTIKQKIDLRSENILKQLMHQVISVKNLNTVKYTVININYIQLYSLSKICVGTAFCYFNALM